MSWFDDKKLLSGAELYKKKTDKKKPVCYKCGKVGHYKNNCKVKNKINELNINEELKNKLLSILSKSESDKEC